MQRSAVQPVQRPSFCPTTGCSSEAAGGQSKSATCRWHRQCQRLGRLGCWVLHCSEWVYIVVNELNCLGFIVNYCDVFAWLLMITYDYKISIQPDYVWLVLKCRIIHHLVVLLCSWMIMQSIVMHTHTPLYTIAADTWYIFWYLNRWQSTQDPANSKMTSFVQGWICLLVSMYLTI